MKTTFKLLSVICVSITLLLVSCTNEVKRETKDTNAWPILKKYDSDHVYKVALPIGGIGTGTISLSGRGELRDWEIMNRPAKDFSGETFGGSKSPFFAIYVKSEGEDAKTKALLGPLDKSEFESKYGRPVYHHGIPRFEKASFETAYPFGQVTLEDESMPVKVKLNAYNPFIPGDVDNSSIPIAILTYEVENLQDKPATVSGSTPLINIL